MIRSLAPLVCLFVLLCHGAQASYYTDISNAFMPNELTYVQVGEERVPIFEIPATTPLARGVVLILAEQTPSGLSLAQAKSLASLMSQKGWHSIVSPVPLVLASPFVNYDVPSTSRQNAELSADSNEENSGTNLTQPDNINDNQNVKMTALHPRQDTRPPVVDYQRSAQHLTLLLNALYEHSKGHRGFRIVIAQGMSAAQILSLGADQKIAPPNTLVTLSPFWPQASINSQIPSAIAGTDFPVLDLAVANVNEWATRTEDNRRFIASTSLKLHYRQQKIPANIFSSNFNDAKKSPYIQLLGGHIIGWTRYLGW
jgi:hypothetical protein